MCSEESYCPRCHKNKESDFVAQSAMQQICDEKQFVNAVVDLTLLKQYPKLFPSDKRLFCAKYDVMLKTLAMNEFLGRPVPNVINLRAMMEEAAEGEFSRLDKTLGFLNDSDEEMERVQFLQQLRMNDIMRKLLKAQGLDFDAVIQAIAKFKMEGMTRTAKAEKKEKKRRISRMKLNNQRKLGAVVKTTENSVQVELEDPEKGCNDSGKPKTAKYYRHYKKSKRPTRI